MREAPVHGRKVGPPMELSMCWRRRPHIETDWGDSWERLCWLKVEKLQAMCCLSFHLKGPTRWKRIQTLAFHDMPCRVWTKVLDAGAV